MQLLGDFADGQTFDEAQSEYFLLLLGKAGDQFLEVFDPFPRGDRFLGMRIWGSSRRGVVFRVAQSASPLLQGLSRRRGAMLVGDQVRDDPQQPLRSGRPRC